jgi:hypothetical protein
MANNKATGLPDIHRFITDHNADGKAVYSKAVPAEASWNEIGDNFRFFLGYTTTGGFPVQLNPVDKAPDVASYQGEMQTMANLNKDNGEHGVVTGADCVSLTGKQALCFGSLISLQMPSQLCTELPRWITA